MLNWLRTQVGWTRAAIAAGNVRLVERVFLPATLALGLALGCFAARISDFFSVLVFVLFGFAIGYGVRSYQSHRRRQKFTRHQSF